MRHELEPHGSCEDSVPHPPHHCRHSLFSHAILLEDFAREMALNSETERLCYGGGALVAATYSRSSLVG